MRRHLTLLRLVHSFSFTDTGLAAYRMGFASAAALWASREAGALWETHVVNQWLRGRAWREPSLGLWYWRDQGGSEVDLLLERGRKMAAVARKIKEQPQRKDLHGFDRSTG